VEARHELDVLADRVTGVAANRLDVLAAEQPEGARDDQDAVDAVEREASDQERAEVLDHLETREVALRQPELDDPSALDPAAVRDADDAADRGDQLRVVDYRLDHEQ
jgi:hypothetical protein